MSMKRSTIEFAKIVSRALLSVSDRSYPRTTTWSPEMEQTLHRLLGCRHSLNTTLVANVIDPFLLNHHSLALGFFNWASQQPRFSHSSNTYHSILKSLSLSRQFNHVHKLLQQVKAQNITLHPSLYTLLISSHIAANKTDAALAIFNQATTVFHIGHETCNSLLAALSSQRNIICARNLFDEMVMRGVSLNTLGFGVFVWKFCANSKLDDTLSLLHEVRKGILGFDFSGSLIALLVVHGLCLQSRVPEAIFMLEELRLRNFKPDFMAYRIVAEASRSSGNVVEVEKILKKKRKLGVAPRSTEYEEFIFLLISERMICEAKEIGEVIVEGNFQIRDDVLNALIGSVSTIDPCAALMFLNFMLRRESFPSLLTLSNLSRSLCKHGRNDEMVEVFKILSSKGYFVDLESHNVMISFLCKAGRLKEAYKVLVDMKKKGLSPDVSSYNSIIEACCRDDMIRPAKRLWDEMFTNGCGGNLKTYNILIRKFSTIGQAEEAHRLFEHMLEKGVTPDATTYESILEGLCQEKKLNAALGVFKKSTEHDPVLAQSILSAFIPHLCKEGYFIAAAKLLRDCALDKGYSYPHVMFVKCLAEAGEVAISIEHIKWVGDNLPLMLPKISSVLLASQLSSPELEPILQLIQQVQENVCYPELVARRMMDLSE